MKIGMIRKQIMRRTEMEITVMQLQKGKNNNNNNENKNKIKNNKIIKIITKSLKSINTGSKHNAHLQFGL
jgi:hypothetical protein